MNTVAYFEVQVDDTKRAVAFYTEVFGWEFVKDESLSIEYWRIKTDGANGGLLKRSAATPPQQSGTNAFVCSMQVKDFDQTAEKILQQGGIVALPKFAVSGKCWQGYFQDTERNTFGLFQVDANAT